MGGCERVGKDVGESKGAYESNGAGPSEGGGEGKQENVAAGLLYLMDCFSQKMKNVSCGIWFIK